MNKLKFIGRTFKYDEPCIVCSHIVYENERVFQIAFDDDEWIQFLCVKNGHEAYEAKVASLGEVLIRHKYVQFAPHISPGQYANIQPNKAWKIFDI